MRGAPPKALTIAGSDSGGGAGIQADLKTFEALGVFGTSVVAALTAQNSLGVSGVLRTPPEFVALQYDAVVSDIAPVAAKTGMLADAAIVRAVRDCLSRRPVRFLVVDPVMIATSGDALLAEGDDALEAYRAGLIPLATVATPNLAEAARLTGRPVRTLDDMRAAARAIVAMGARAALVKGGHLADATRSPDVYFDGEREELLEAPRVDSPNTHGSGCTLSAALAAFLARGETPLEAARRAKAYVSRAIAASYAVGAGPGPLAHRAGAERDE